MALISCKDLMERIEISNVVILQATVFVPGLSPTGPQSYQEGHIPKALLFDLDKMGPDDPIKPHRKPELAELAEHLGNLGISSDDHVVVYDCWGQLVAARVWWMLRELGHPHVSVLDGGLIQWKLEGYPCSTKVAEQQKTTYTPKGSLGASDMSAHPWWAQQDQVRTVSAALKQGDRSTLLIDARAKDRFSGTSPDIWPNRRSGHIPGAQNMPFTDLIDAETKTFKSANDIQRKFDDLGVHPSQDLICSCGSGVTACVLALALEIIGHEGQVQIYDGSWAEWGHEDSATNVEQG